AAVTTAATATVSAATASAAATVSAATATATATIFTWLGFVDRQRATIVLLVVESLNCRLSAVVFAHFNKTKSLAATGFAILNHFGTANFAELGEQFLQTSIGDVVTQVTDVQFLTHSSNSVKTRTFDLYLCFQVDSRSAAARGQPSSGRDEKELVGLPENTPMHFCICRTRESESSRFRRVHRVLFPRN